MVSCIDYQIDIYPQLSHNTSPLQKFLFHPENFDKRLYLGIPRASRRRLYFLLSLLRQKSVPIHSSKSTINGKDAARVCKTNAYFIVHANNLFFANQQFTIVSMSPLKIKLGKKMIYDSFAECTFLSKSVHELIAELLYTFPCKRTSDKMSTHCSSLYII